MDKEKITSLFKDYGEAMRAWGESKYENDVIYEDIKGLKSDLIAALNSKITMPKVFDDWYIQYGTIEDFMFSFVDSEQGNELEGSIQDLFMWLYDESLMINSKKLSRCIEAIQVGDYEVEK